MLSYIARIIQPFLKIHKGEWPKVLLMFGYFFLVIATYYIIKPVRSSIFLDRLGADKLPLVYMGEALVVGVVAFFYSKFVDRHKKENILLTSTAVFSACLFIFWFLFRFQAPWFAFVFYLWGAVFSVMAVTQFWLLANDLFDPREAKRLFGIIGSGGVLGAICGGFLTNRTAYYFGTENLLLVAAGIIFLCVIFIRIACRYEPAEIKTESRPETRANGDDRRKRTILKILTGSTYLLLILLLIGIGKIVATFIDFQFQSVVGETFASKNEKTAFFGGFFAALNGAAFVIQLFLTSRILKKFGIGAALLLLPIGLTMGLAGFLMVPILWFAGFNKFYDGSLNYSIHSASREILYLPVNRTDRHKIKPFIDMFIYRFSKGIGGLLIFILISIMGLSLRGVTVFALLVITIWLLVILLLKREYIEALKRIVLNQEQPASELAETTEKSPVSLLESLGDDNLRKIFLEIKSESKRLNKRMMEISQLSLFDKREQTDIGARYFIRSLYEHEFSGEGMKWQNETGDSRKKEEGVEDLVMRVVKKEISIGKKEGGVEEKVPDDWYLKLREYIQDKSNPDSIRRRAVEALAILKTKTSKTILMESLSDKEETLRYEIIKALNKTATTGRMLGIDVLIEQIKPEINRLKMTQKLRVVCTQHLLNNQTETAVYANFENAVNSLHQESLERIFRLLALHYPPDIIHLIYDRFQEGDDYVRANAVELLDNLLDTRLQGMVLAAIENEIKKEEVNITRTTIDELFKEIVEGYDIWMKLLVIFMTSHFGIKEFYSKLKELEHDKYSVIKEAALLAVKRIEKDNRGKG